MNCVQALPTSVVTSRSASQSSVKCRERAGESFGRAHRLCPVVDLGAIDREPDWPMRPELPIVQDLGAGHTQMPGHDAIVNGLL
eukprot:8297704-Pyramimonas_sp.AAC.1